MPARQISILDENEGPWADLLHEFFEDTASRIEFSHEPQGFRNLLDRGGDSGVMFLRLDLLTLNIAQAVHARRETCPRLRVFGLGKAGGNTGTLKLDDCFDEVPSISDFQKRVLKHLPLPEKVRVLVIDNEEEIGKMIQDFFERRVDPSFEVEYFTDGRRGLERMASAAPDVLILDVKMPVMDGRDVYREMQKSGRNIPTIVFFDAISGDEIAEMRKHGRPAVVEKGAPQSSLPELIELVKKMSFFS